MEYVKTVALAAIAAAALVAFIGASTASATVLCANNTSTTGCTSKYPAGTLIEQTLKSGTSLRETDTSGLITLATCTGSSLTGPAVNAGSATETAKDSLPASNVTWSGCTNPTTTISNGELEVHWIAGTDNGTLTAKNTEIEVRETASGSCVFTAGTGTDLGTLTGGAGDDGHQRQPHLGSR